MHFPYMSFIITEIGSPVITVDSQPIALQKFNLEELSPNSNQTLVK